MKDSSVSQNASPPPPEDPLEGPRNADPSGRADPMPEEAAVHAWARLLRASDRLIAEVEADLEADGFPPLAWYDALLELRRAGPGEGLRPFQLQERMLLAQYNVSRLTDRLIGAGFAERAACPEDRRGHVVRLTPAGRDLVKRMSPAYLRAIDTHFAGKLAPGEAETLARLLGKLTG